MDVFSVYNDKSGGKINFNSLTPAMLDFVTGGNAEAATAYREAKKEYNGTVPSALAMEIMGEDRFSLISPYLTFSTGGSDYYYVVGTGEPGLVATEDLVEEKPQKTPGSRNSVLIKKRGSAYTILAWQERYI